MTRHAGIAIDRYKLDTFRQHLRDAGYTFTTHPGLTADTIMLRVEYETLEPLQAVVNAAHTAPRSDGAAHTAPRSDGAAHSR